MRVPCWLSLCFLSLLTPAYGQGLSGLIYDRATGQPLIGASVCWADSLPCLPTDSSGRYAWASLPPGGYTLRVFAPGYQACTRRAYVGRRGLTLLNVGLRPLALQPSTTSLPLPLRLHSDAWQRRQPRSSPEGLNGWLPLWLQQDQHAGGQAVAQGLTGQRLLLRYDGIRLHHSAQSPHSSPWLGLIAPAAVQRLRYQPSGSVTGGSDALGGLLDLDAPPLSLSDSATRWQGQGQLRAFTQRMGWQSQLQIARRSPRQALRIAGELGQYGDKMGGQRTRWPAAYRQQGLRLALLRSLSSRSSLQLAYLLQQQQDVVAPQPGFALRQYDLRRLQLAYLRWTLRPDPSRTHTLRLTTSVQRYQTVLRSRPDSLPDQTQHQTQDWQRVGLQGEWDCQPGPAWQIRSGFDLAAEQAQSRAEQANAQGQRLPRPSRYDGGALAWHATFFTQHRWDWPRWALTAGIRGLGRDLQVSTDSFGDQQWRPLGGAATLGGWHQLAPGQQLSAHSSLDLRMPGLFEASAPGPMRNGILVPHRLQPEYALSHRIAYRLSGAAWQVQAQATHRWLWGLMAIAPGRYRGQATWRGQPVYRWQHTEAGHLLAAQAQAVWHLSLLQVEGALSAAWGRSYAGTPWPGVPPLHGHFRLHYARHGFWLTLESLAAAAQPRLSPAEQRDPAVPVGGTPGWLIINLRGGYQANGGAITLAGENLTDRLYRRHGGSLPGYGRSAWLSVGLAF